MQRKRQLIERGQLQTWQRHGRGSFAAGHSLMRRSLIETVLRYTGLRTRGERNALSAVIRHIRFEFDALPRAFCGFTMLHLSDIHVDGLAGLADSICARIHDLEVDLCVLTGDYRFRVYGPCDNVYTNMEKILASINARYGTVGILGNHDAAEKVPVLQGMGVTMLVNEAFELQHDDHSMWLIGLDDPHYYGCDDLPGALHGVPEDAFKLLLVHTPELYAEAAASGIHLYLCGHTHGGQICMPVLGPVITGANCPRKYARGMWQYRAMQGYTSAGVGSSVVPARFCCPPEIGLIQLHRKACHHRELSHLTTKMV